MSPTAAPELEAPAGGDISRRALFRAIGAGAAIVGLGSVLEACSSGSSPSPGPTATGTPTPGAEQPDIGFAMSDSLFGLSEAEIGHRLAIAKALGATAIRVDFDGLVDNYTADGTATWEQSDHIMEAANAQGLHVLATVSYSPVWDRNHNAANDYGGRPREVEPFALFAGAVAKRYKDKGLRKFEIWNEENISPGGTNPAKNNPKNSPGGADPVEYAALYKAARQKIKEAFADEDESIQQEVKVAIGGLAPSDTEGKKVMSPADFLAALYDANIGEFDALALHPYSAPALPDQNESWSGFTQIEGDPGKTVPDLGRTVYDVLADHGDAHKEIWLTENGAPTNGTGVKATLKNQQWDTWNNRPDPYVDEDLQARTVTQVLTHHFKLANVTDRYIYTLMDSPPPNMNRKQPPTADENFYGVIGYKWKASLHRYVQYQKKAAAAFSQAAHRVRQRDKTAW